MKIFRHRPSQRTCRQYPDQNTAGLEHDGHSGRGTCTARPIDAYASTVSGHGHTMDMANHRPPIPSREGTQTRREGITALSNGFTTILNLAADPCSPHRQRTRPEPAEDAQPIRPSTRARGANLAQDTRWPGGGQRDMSAPI